MSDHSEILRQTNFTQLDWVIVAVYLGISILIGIMVKKYSTGMANYIGAGRSVGTWLGIATMTGTELGLITVMYSAETGFSGGFAAFHIALVAGVVTMIIGLTGFIVAPLRAQGVLTIPEFYERRFGRRTRILGGIVLAFGGILNMGLFLKIGSMFIVGVAGLSENGLALPIVMTVLLTLVLIYTVMGGMISVIITDYIQFVLLAAGMIITTFMAINYLGWTNIVETLQSEMGEKGWNPLVEDGPFGPAYVTWMVFMGLVGCAVWPTAVSRALAMESTKAVRWQYTISSVSFAIRFMIPCFWGLCAFVFIRTSSDLLPVFFPGFWDSLAGAEAESGLYAMPVFLGRILPAGLIGIITAAMVAAFMSTHDSYLLCWSSVITQDVIAPLSKKELTDERRVFLTRSMIVIIGIYILAWGLFYNGGDAIWTYMAITGSIYFTGAIPVLVGGLYWKRASSTGAFCALVTGCSAVLGLEPLRFRIGAMIFTMLGRSTEPDLVAKTFTGERVGLFAIAMAMIVFVVGSLAFPDPPKESENEKTS